MSDYNQQYATEENLFGSPYPEFAKLVAKLGGGDALDIGCGQGRDALLLARHGFRVTGIDASSVGIAQMLARAKGLPVTGIVADFYNWQFPQDYDLIVLDSILHFAADKDKERALLDRVFAHTHPGGHVAIFIHKSPAKEKALHAIFAAMQPDWVLVENGYIDYVYEEKAINFRSEFQFCMLVMQRQPAA